MALGRRAIGEYTDVAKGRLLRALNSMLGSSLVHVAIRIKVRYIAFTDIICMFVDHLRGCLENHVGELVENVVLGRPMQFVDDNPEADDAAQSELEKAARAMF